MLDLALERLLAAEPRRRAQVLNHIEDILTPREYLALGEALRDPELIDLYGRRTVTKIMAGQQPESFERRRIAPHVLYFGDPAHDRTRKTLLVGFAGRLGRLMIPNVGFLQCLPAEHFDMVVINDPEQLHFRRGSQGYADSFMGLVAAIERDFPAATYGRVVSIGASMGGLPAVWYGLMAPARRSICVGGRAAWDVTRLIEGQAPPHAYDPICACCEKTHAEVVFVYAQDHSIDRVQAGHFAGLLGAQTLPIPAVRSHSPLAHLWQTGSLPHFLNQLTRARSFQPRWVIKKFPEI